MKAPRNTIWGRVQHQEKLCDGVYFLSTASHGGVWVHGSLVDQIPLEMREMSFCQNGMEGWFEEDCDWCIPYVVFEDRIKEFKAPDECKTITEDTHNRLFRMRWPEVWERWQQSKSAVAS